MIVRSVVFGEWFVEELEEGMLFKAEPWVNSLAITPDLHHSP